jgi:hypothetical protein
MTEIEHVVKCELTGETEVVRQHLPSPTWTDLGLNPECRDEIPATNRLGYGTANWTATYGLHFHVDDPCLGLICAKVSKFSKFHLAVIAQIIQHELSFNGRAVQALQFKKRC